LEKVFEDAVKSKAYAEFLEKIDSELGYANGADAEKQLEEHYVKWGRLLKELKESGLQIN